MAKALLRQSAALSGLVRVARIGQSCLDLETFRRRAFLAEAPLHVKRDIEEDGGTDRGAEPARFPALIRRLAAGSAPDTAAKEAISYLEQFSAAMLPYELMYPPLLAARGGRPPDRAEDNHAVAKPDSIAAFCAWLSGHGAAEADGTMLRRGLAELLAYHVAAATEDRGDAALDLQGPQQQLVRMQAPLGLLVAALEFNEWVAASETAATATKDDSRVALAPSGGGAAAAAAAAAAPSPLTQLYIAQASLSELPADMQQDVQAPDLVTKSGRGDVYDASLWLGLEPTYTPWHRDPNPNLFCQLCSGKTVRLMPPAAGEAIFHQVQDVLMRKQQQQQAYRHSRIRGEEMMQGPERQALHDAIWSVGSGATAAAAPHDAGQMQEALLEPGDMLFIPKGWWHSVKSGFGDGRLNASINWWFR